MISESFWKIPLKIGTRPPGHVLRLLYCLRFAQIVDFVDQNCHFWSRRGEYGNFSILTAYISNCVAASPSLCQTCFAHHYVRRVRWGVLMLWKIERGMASFLAPRKKFFFCLCYFCLFFHLTFRGGNPEPKLVPETQFRMKTGIFTACNLKQSLFTEIVHLYLHQNFHFCVLLLSKLQVIGQNGAQTFRRITSSMLL